MDPLPHGNPTIFASLSAFQQSIRSAEERHAFDQLILVGSSNDIAWAHASMHPSAAQHVVAEIEYPLLPAWFRQPMPLATLSHALAGIFAD